MCCVRNERNKSTTQNVHDHSSVFQDTAKNTEIRKRSPAKYANTLEPIGSMYGIFTYIYHRNHPNVGKYTIHGSYG